MGMLVVPSRQLQLVGAAQAPCLPAPLALGYPDVCLNDLAWTMYGTQAFEKVAARNDHEIPTPACEAQEHEHPVVGRRLCQFLSVQAPPAACSELLLELPCHMRDKEILQ